jgi:hypothetical protein
MSSGSVSVQVGREASGQLLQEHPGREEVFAEFDAVGRGRGLPVPEWHKRHCGRQALLERRELTLERVLVGNTIEVASASPERPSDFRSRHRLDHADDCLTGQQAGFAGTSTSLQLGRVPQVSVGQAEERRHGPARPCCWPGSVPASRHVPVGLGS